LGIGLGRLNPTFDSSLSFIHNCRFTRPEEFINYLRRLHLPLLGLLLALLLCLSGLVSSLVRLYVRVSISITSEASVIHRACIK
jgi:hypothetical protein